MLSITKRLTVSVIGIVSICYGAIFVVSEIVIYRDRLQRHERLVMSTSESIQERYKALESSQEGNSIQNNLSDFSNSRVLVWLSRQSNSRPPVFPSNQSSQILVRDKQLLKLAGVDAIGMQKPRSFVFNGKTYFTCSMPLPDGRGVLRFLEDVGIAPASREENNLILLLAWISLVVISAIILRLALKESIRPIHSLEKALDSVKLDRSGSFFQSKDSIQEQPEELQGILNSYMRLAKRLQDSWNRQNAFAGAMSHELLSPLTLMRNSSKRLDKLIGNEEPRQKELVRTLEDESKRAEALAKNLIDLARNDNGQIKINLSEFVIFDTIIELLNDIQSLSWAKRVKLDPSSEELNRELKSSLVIGDPDRMRQCLLNVIENSIKYTEESSITTIRLHKDSSSYYILISDQGKGIPESQKELIFEPFYRVNDAENTTKPGSGIGLAIVKILMVQMHGDIKVVDTNKPGACFELKLNLVENLDHSTNT